MIADLKDIGVREGKPLLVHASLRSVGEIEGGAETLVEAFREVLGANGTLLVPAFTSQRRDPALRENAPASQDEIEALRRTIPPYDLKLTPCDLESVGRFAETIRLQPDAFRSDHPGFSFAAMGGQAKYFTENTPFHYPLGSDSPLARLHTQGGYVLLIGVGQSVNISLRTAEIWANVPYIHRTRLVKTNETEWRQMKGSPECAAGFERIELALRQARLLQSGYLGNAPCQLMRQQEIISMAVAMLQGAADSLLCNNPYCPHCALAFKTSSPSTYIDGQSV